VLCDRLPAAIFTKDISIEEMNDVRFSLEEGVRFHIYPLYRLSKPQQDFLRQADYDVRIVIEE
jgi:hypothetical protein